MTKNEMITLLNEIIGNERYHFNYYMNAFLNVKGLERVFLAPIFEKEMRSELEHILEFSNKVVALGGIPNTQSRYLSVQFFEDAISLVKHAIEIEREILRIYHNAYPLVEKYVEEHKDMSIALLLEENIEHTTKDVEELEKLLPRII